MNNGTVELNHTNFLTKIDIIKNAIIILEDNFDFSSVNYLTGLRFKLVKNIFKKIEDNYEVDVINILTKYYKSSNCSKIIDKYNTEVASGNYYRNLYKCYDFVYCLSDYIQDKEIKEKLWDTLKQYTYTRICTTIKDINYDICPCGIKMKVYPDSSELKCESCGYITILYGTVFEDTQFYNQEGNTSKNGRYDPSRHCKSWICKIQAMDNTDIEKKCLDQVMYCIKRDNIKDNRKLSCSQIRLYLKECHYTKYNDHVPLIRKLLTGVIPPQLTRQELISFYNLFDKAVTMFESTKPDGKSNTMYYPYIIYKILESILHNSMRKRRILECIHLQGRDTLINSDNLWELICNKVPEITFKNTDRIDQELEI
jgi:hypothetical protein